MMRLTKMFSIALSVTLVFLLGMGSAHAITFTIDEVNNVLNLQPVLPGSVILCEGGVIPCVPPPPGVPDQDQPGFWSDVLTFTPNAVGSVAVLTSDFCGETVCPPADILLQQAPPPNILVPELIFTFGGTLWEGAIYTPGPTDPGFLPGPDPATYVILSDQVVPLPAAAWLLGSALGILGWVRRRSD